MWGIGTYGRNGFQTTCTTNAINREYGQAIIEGNELELQHGTRNCNVLGVVILDTGKITAEQWIQFCQE